MTSKPIIADPRFRGGANVQLTVNSLGVMATARRVGQRFSGFYGIALGPNYCTIAAGTVQSVPVGKDGPVTPTVGGIAIGGDATHSSPQLALTSGVVTETGISFVTLEVIPTAAGVLDHTTTQRINHLGTLTPPMPKSYLQVIALIQWRNSRPWKAMQNVYFNLQFMLMASPAGAGPQRGFFAPC